MACSTRKTDACGTEPYIITSSLSPEHARTPANKLFNRWLFLSWARFAKTPRPLLRLRHPQVATATWSEGSSLHKIKSFQLKVPLCLCSHILHMTFCNSICRPCNIYSWNRSRAHEYSVVTFFVTRQSWAVSAFETCVVNNRAKGVRADQTSWVRCSLHEVFRCFITGPT